MINTKQKRQDILNIFYNLQKGLTLSWNFRGLLNNHTFFRHLFIIYQHLTPLFDKMLNSILAKIKIGDFFTIVVVHQESGPQSTELNWMEKTCSNDNKIKISNIFNVDNSSEEALLKFIGEQAINYSDPVIVNFCLQDRQEIHTYRRSIEKLRIYGFYPYFINFISDFQEHNISVSTGFNQLSLSDENLSQIIKIYKALSYQTGILSAKMQLQSPDVQIINKNGDHWQSIDFNRVQRCYYGPSIYYKQDIIDFINESPLKLEDSFHFNIKLQIRLFSGIKLTTNKIIVLKTNNLKMNLMTKAIGMESKSTFEFAKMIRSKSQPFCSSAFLFLTKIQKDDKKQSQMC